MMDFIQKATTEFGIDAGAAKSAAGGILNMVKDNADKADFGSLMDKMPDLKSVMTGGAGAGGGVGGLLGKVGGMLGGGAGSALSVAGVFEKSGLSMDKAGGFVSMPFGWIKGKVGGDLVGRLLGSVPQLKSLID